MRAALAKSESADGDKEVQIKVDSVLLDGTLNVPVGATGIVLFAHGSGSSRYSPRNQYVARVIREHGVGTLLFDLLTSQEEAIDNYTREFRFDVKLLAHRLIGATKWLTEGTETRQLRPGYFGSSTGGGGALIAAAALGSKIGAVVSRGGRPDLAGERKDLYYRPHRPAARPFGGETGKWTCAGNFNQPVFAAGYLV